MNVEPGADDTLILGGPGIAGSYRLDPVSAAIWNLLDGRRNTAQVMDLFQSHYSGEVGVGEEVLSAIKTFSSNNLIVFDGGPEALEYRSHDVIRSINAPPVLERTLEDIRSFLFRELRIEEAEDLESDLDALLGEQALEAAKARDVDSAGSVNDSKVIVYQKALKLEALNASMETVARQLKTLLPEVEGNILVSGNAIYLRGSHMGWHSNHSRADGRIYCSWSESTGNFFRFVHPMTNAVETLMEKPGWNIKSFTIPPRPYRFWHCIGARGLRLSLGFRYEY